MKGIIFTLLEDLVRRDHGDDAWDAILEEADVDGVYTTLGTYSHEDLVDLLDAAASYTGHSGREAQRWFGRHALHQLAETYPELFQMFRQGHRSARGEGIGLAVCQKIVDRHGGSIWVDTEPGEGSTFHFTVPAADTEERTR